MSVKIKYEDVERNRPFIIAKMNKSGKLMDYSKFQIDGKDNILRIWFRHENFWINAPDNRTESAWHKAIEKWGVIYD